MEKVLLRITFSACLLFGAYMFNSNTIGGFSSDLTGSPLSSTTCQNGCHNSFALNSGVGSVSMSVPTDYYPGSVYSVSLTVNESVPKYGFMAGVLRDDNTNGGSFANGTGSSATTIAGRSYTRHNGANTTGTWTFDWTAPSYEDTITFYYVGNAANNASGNNGDYIYTSSTTIYPLDLITFDTAITAASCFNTCDGSISLSNTTGGAGGPYTYDWSNNSSGASITGVCGGTYTVTITDDDGNEEVSTLFIPSPSPIISNINGIGSTCTGGSGSASVMPNGGAGGYSYLWNTGSTDSTIQNLALGWYYITITDANGCTTVDSTEVMEQGSGLLADLVVNEEDCGQANGSITVNVLNGTSPHSYAWNTGATTAILNNIAAGSYTVTITDAQGCEENFTATVLENVVDIDENGTSITSVVCPGIPSGSIDLEIAEGTPPLTFAWSNSEITEDLSNLLGGSYTVTVTDANGCTDVASFDVFEPDSIDAVADAVNAAEDACTGSISITAMGGNGGFTYSWSHDASATGPTQTDLCAGDYSITVADVNGCNVILDVTLEGIGVGTEELSTNSVSVYPNPTQDRFFLDSGDSDVLEVVLTDLSGRTLRTWKSAMDDNFSLDGIASGRYQLFISTDSRLVVRPLLIHR
jgi:hypothetical protein